MLRTLHRIIIGNSQQMPEIADNSIHLMVTSPPYPMIQMWDKQFCELDPKIDSLWKKLETDGTEETVTEIYDAMHENLARVWKETHRVLVEGGIACINIGDATRTVNGRFRLFPNHSRVIEHCERLGFTTLPYILWKKPTTKPQYKGKGAFLGSGFLPPNAYVTLDCEFILIFRKGKLREFQAHDENRYSSRFTKKQRDKWFTQIWTVTGKRQTTSQIERRTAAFPDEIAERLIRMFSVRGDTILDPFLGSGTTIQVAMQNERNSIGYEADSTLLPVITSRIANCTSNINAEVKIIKR
ncbi:MAG: site-specific DNA-methyltransferase [Candidatus Bathyarchaeia archaeon]